MPQRVGDWGNGFMPCGEDEGESALASYRCAEAVFPVAGMVRRIPYTKERETVGGCVGLGHRVDWFVDVEPVGGEEGPAAP